MEQLLKERPPPAFKRDLSHLSTSGAADCARPYQAWKGQVAQEIERRRNKPWQLSYTGAP